MNSIEYENCNTKTVIDIRQNVSITILCKQYKCTIVTYYSVLPNLFSTTHLDYRLFCFEKCE